MEGWGLCPLPPCVSDCDDEGVRQRLEASLRRLFKVLAVFVGIIVIEEIFETVLQMWAFKSRNPRVIGWLTSYHRHVTNPVMVRFFSGRSSVAALLHHVGRRSGRAYATPLTAHRSEDTIIVPLPYGTETDWLRNLEAAGRGVVELEGRRFSVDEPEVVLIDEVMSLLPPLVVRIVRMHDTEHALKLHVAESNGLSAWPVPRPQSAPSHQTYVPLCVLHSVSES